jgi:hypothetical protein
MDLGVLAEVADVCITGSRRGFELPRPAQRDGPEKRRPLVRRIQSLCGVEERKRILWHESERQRLSLR